MSLAAGSPKGKQYDPATDPSTTKSQSLTEHDEGRVGILLMERFMSLAGRVATSNAPHTVKKYDPATDSGL